MGPSGSAGRMRSRAWRRRVGCHRARESGRFRPFRPLRPFRALPCACRAPACSWAGALFAPGGSCTVEADKNSLRRFPLREQRRIVGVAVYRPRRRGRKRRKDRVATAGGRHIASGAERLGSASRAGARRGLQNRWAVSKPCGRWVRFPCTSAIFFAPTSCVSHEIANASCS